MTSVDRMVLRIASAAGAANERPLRADSPAAAAGQGVQRSPGELVAAGRHSSDEAVRQALGEAGRRLAQIASELTFDFDESAGRIIVRLVDKRTGEVLRQIPSDEALAIARALQDAVAAGALLRTDA